MDILHSLPPYNFCGLDKEDTEFKKAKVVVLPVPYDSTTSYGVGARNGPHAIIHASRNMELYDHETKASPYELGIHTLDELAPSRDGPKETVRRIKEAIGDILDTGKFPLMLGGEHSITTGALQAFAERNKDFSVLQLDAHADLRDEFEGTKFSHACVMRRAREITDVVQVGIRSMCKDEAEHIRQKKLENIFYMPLDPADFDKQIPKIIGALKGNVYITFDIDALDPSEMPSTGTPEPAGMRSWQVLKLIKAITEKKKIIGMDIVELSPIPGNVAPDFLAAKLAYKMLGYAFLSELKKKE